MAARRGSGVARFVVGAAVSVLAVLGLGVWTTPPAHALDTPFTAVNKSGHQLTLLGKTGNYSLEPPDLPSGGSGTFRVVFHLGQDNAANLRYAIGSTGYQLALTATPSYGTFAPSLRCTVRDAADTVLATGTGPFRCTTSGTTVTVAAPEAVYVGHDMVSATLAPVATEGAVLPGSAIALPASRRMAFRSWAGASSRVTYAVRLPDGTATPRVWVAVSAAGARTCGGDLPCSVSAWGVVRFVGTERVRVVSSHRLDGGELAVVHNPFATLTEAPAPSAAVVEVGSRAVYRLPGGDEVVLTRRTPQGPVTCETARTGGPQTVCAELPETDPNAVPDEPRFYLDTFVTAPFVPVTRADRRIDISALGPGAHRDALIGAIEEWNRAADAGWTIGGAGSPFRVQQAVTTASGGTACPAGVQTSELVLGVFSDVRSGDRLTGGTICAVDDPSHSSVFRKHIWMHELGHALGLDHDPYWDTVMYSSRQGASRSTLHPKDVAVFRFREAYPTVIRKPQRTVVVD